MGHVRADALTGAADRAAAAVGALGRAGEAATAALRHLLAADDVAWTGAGAAAYRAAIADLLHGVRVARDRLADAGEAAAAHARAVREEEASAAAAWSAGLPALRLPVLGPGIGPPAAGPDRWGAG